MIDRQTTKDIIMNIFNLCLNYNVTTPIYHFNISIGLAVNNIDDKPKSVVPCEKKLNHSIG